MLEILGIEKAFGSIHAVQKVDLIIPKVEFFSLLGPSGCGKTTLLRILAGFESPSAGEIRHDGRRIDALPPDRRLFNIVFQRYALFPHLSIWENVAFGLKMKATPASEVRARVAEMLALVKLGGMENRRIDTLSGGQQQRVALARALVNRPRVLLLDEPLSALDLKLRQEMQVELRAIQRRLGLTFIFVTHDQEEALTLSDRIAVMNEGRIEQVGTPEEIYENPKTLFVAKFIGSINSFPGKLLKTDSSEAQVEIAGRASTIRRDLKGLRTLPTLTPGRRVRVLVRPEKIKIEPASGLADQREPGLRGVLREILYQGAATQFVIECADFPEAPVLVSQPNAALGLSGKFRIADPVALSWAPEDAILLAEGEG